MVKKNNYRESIIRLRAQLECAIAHLKSFDASQDWQTIISQEADTRITPEYREALMAEFQSRAKANLKAGAGRKPDKKIIVDGQETTYRQLAQKRHVTVATARNQVWKARQASTKQSD